MTLLPRSCVAGALALALLAGASREARAEPCAADDAWRTIMGALRPGLSCGTFLAATDGSMTAFSYGLFSSVAPVALPFSFSAVMRRLGPEGMPLELWVIGAVVLVKEEACGLYVPTDDVRFQREGWHSLPGVHIHEEHRVTVRQTAEHVSLVIDGQDVAAWALHAPQASEKVSFGFKGASGYRSWASFRDVRVEAE